MRTTLCLGVRHIGHAFIAGAHPSQTHRWPHGIKAITALLSRHTTHASRSIESLDWTGASAACGGGGGGGAEGALAAAQLWTCRGGRVQERDMQRAVTLELVPGMCT